MPAYSFGHKLWLSEMREMPFNREILDDAVVEVRGNVVGNKLRHSQVVSTLKQVNRNGDLKKDKAKVGRRILTGQRTCHAGICRHRSHQEPLISEGCTAPLKYEEAVEANSTYEGIVSRNFF